MDVKKYLYITKPGIVLGNVLIALGAYLFGAALQPQVGTFIGLLLGTSFIIAGSCVLNNYLDRAIDSRMQRTANRSKIVGSIPPKIALPYAALLVLAGSFLLFKFTNVSTLLIGLIGALWYVAVYGWAKRHTPLSTLIGTVAGATPPLAGYVAATNTFDMTAWILFFILVFWQMPHFYAIALFREQDYKKAGIPLLNLVKGTARTVFEMKLYAGLFLATIVIFFLTSFVSGPAFLIMLGVALFWIRQHNTPVVPGNEAVWARGVFKTSLLILPLYALLWAADAWLWSVPCS